jgi:hypothetical protein
MAFAESPLVGTNNIPAVARWFNYCNAQ